MTQLLKNINYDQSADIQAITQDAVRFLEDRGYLVVEINDSKPWGAYIRINNADADTFISEFFPGLTPGAARLGIDNAELSPKILIVSPGQRLSWQYHDRRAERWRFLTEGAFYKSMTDDEQEKNFAKPGDVVQFERGERHRLAGLDSKYVVVAEIWQHVDPGSPSNEDDIVRLQDDYSR